MLKFCEEPVGSTARHIKKRNRRHIDTQLAYTERKLAYNEGRLTDACQCGVPHEGPLLPVSQ